MSVIQSNGKKKRDYNPLQKETRDILFTTAKYIGHNGSINSITSAMQQMLRRLDQVLSRIGN